MRIWTSKADLASLLPLFLVRWRNALTQARKSPDENRKRARNSNAEAVQVPWPGYKGGAGKLRRPVFWHIAAWTVVVAFSLVILTWSQPWLERVTGWNLPQVVPPASVGHFTVGSTKAEVRLLQGPPSSATDNVWRYRSSEVYFVADRVVGWRSSRLSPLRAQTSTPAR